MELENRKFPTGVVFLQGIALGLLAFGLSEASIPHLAVDPGTHDVLLAQRLGLIYTPAVGLWLGWLQRSRRRAAIGGAIGLGIGVAYAVLCTSRNFLAIMVTWACRVGRLKQESRFWRLGGSAW